MNSLQQEWFSRSRDGGWPFALGRHRWGALPVDPPEADTFRLVIVHAGASAARVNDQRLWWEAPGLGCLGPRDRWEPGTDQGLDAELVVFRPLILNQAFGEQDVYDEAAFDDTANQDRFYLEPFLAQTPRTFQAISPVVHRRVQALVQTLGGELTVQADRYWPCRARSYLIELLFLVRTVFDTPGSTEPALPAPAAPGSMEPVALYLLSHIHEDLTIAGLAAEFGTNRTTLMQRFKQEYGRTINEYLTEQRVRRAAMMLRESTLPLAEAYGRHGFTSPSHFSRTFRRLMGLSPTEYRALHP